MSDADLTQALCASAGIVCAVGAGGKKTTLYRLLRAHTGRVGCTATMLTPPFPAALPAQPVVGAPDTIVTAVLAATRQYTRIAYACVSDKPGRLAGLAPDQVARCHAEGGFGLTLVKADGARMRLLKAPGPGEPNLVEGTATVLGLVSAHAVGMPLSARHVHRPERVAAIAGARLGDVLTPRHLARVIASADGLLRGVGNARVVPVINMADSAGYRKAALEAAHIALDLGDRYDRVVVAAMRAESPIVEVVTRSCA